MKEKLITVRETSQILNMSEKEIIELAKKGKIPSYFVGKEFLRFPSLEIENLKDKIQDEFNVLLEKPTPSEQIQDFFYFNDFYIVSFIIVGFLVSVIIFG
jgi:excisionase family DNA binding protein